MAKAPIKTSLKIVPVLFLLLASLWLRLANLGYSDYQGDEIKALASPLSGQSLVDFLFQQRKGPVQFLTSYLIKLAHPALTNRFLVRLPFALAGFAAIWVFYRLVRLHYGSKVAVIAALFLSINGSMIGLTRIVQYQSIVILFSILALYCFSLAIKVEQWKIAGLYVGMLCWAIAILSHFDGIFIAPFAAYLLVRWFREAPDLTPRQRLIHLAAPAGFAALLLGIYFIPYLASLRTSTQQYWWLRITGDEPGAGAPSSIFTFNLYNPLLAIYVYAILGALSLLQIRRSYPIWLWFAFPWVVLELVVGDPGTHIYTYLLPACILLALGVDSLEALLRRLRGGRAVQTATYSLIALVVLFLAGVSHLIFIDHSPEYPWEERRILFWTVGKPDETYRMWAFGFPYFRRWDEIGNFVSLNSDSRYYSTNENKSIASYFIPYPFDINRSGYYIHIYHPQSLRERLADDKVRYWTKNYSPVRVFDVGGKIVAAIYQMPEGGVDEIKSLGY
jgi:4-amino-4-deoxy-L-arabinose transferase-like glycosyltransferase